MDSGNQLTDKAFLALPEKKQMPVNTGAGALAPLTGPRPFLISSDAAKRFGAGAPAGPVFGSSTGPTLKQEQAFSHGSRNQLGDCLLEYIFQLPQTGWAEMLRSLS